MTQIPFLVLYFTQLSLNLVPVFPLLCLHPSQSLVLALCTVINLLYYYGTVVGLRFI